MRVVSTVVMPGGWQYKQKLLSSPQRPQYQLITGATYDQLLANVLAFRLHNLEMVAAGTATKEIVDQDVQFWICGQFPNNCTGSRAQFTQLSQGRWPGKTARVDYRRPLTRIESWITTLTEAELKWVDHLTAQSRAMICARCPLNQNWRTGCGSCNANAERRSALIRGAHTTGLEAKLKHCVAYGTLLDVSVWLVDDYANVPKSKVRIPENCWKLK